MAKITPSPWVVDRHDDNGNLVVRGSEHGGHFIVCQLDAEDYWDEAEGTDEANARLIAVAPELLELCRNLHDTLTMTPSQHIGRHLRASWRGKAVAILKKMEEE